MESVDIHERLKVCRGTNNLVNRPMGACEMVSVCEEIRIGYNRNNMLVHMAKLVVRIAKDYPQHVLHCSVSRLEYK